MLTMLFKYPKIWKRGVGAMAGATIKEIQELAGHKTINMSARYAHLSPMHNQSVVDRIAIKTISAATARSNRHHQPRRPPLYWAAFGSQVFNSIGARRGT
jgi:hypothetical protein